MEDLHEPVAHTERSESPQEEQSARLLPQEGVSVMGQVGFIVSLDPEVLIQVFPHTLLLPG